MSSFSMRMPNNNEQSLEVPCMDEEEDMGIFSQDLERLGNAAEAILDSIRKEALVTPNETTVRDTHDYDDDDDDIEDEILRLGSVEATIRQDIDAQNVDSMTTALSSLGSIHRYRYTPTMLTIGKEDAAQFIQAHKLHGTKEEPNNTIVLMTIFIWSVLLALTAHVKYGSMDGEGKLAHLVELWQMMLA